MVTSSTRRPRCVSSSSASAKKRVGLLPWRELDEEIDITVCMRLPAQDRSEQGESGHTQRANRRLALCEPLDGLLAIENRRLHSQSLSTMKTGIQWTTARPDHWRSTRIGSRDSHAATCMGNRCRRFPPQFFGWNGCQAICKRNRCRRLPAQACRRSEGRKIGWHLPGNRLAPRLLDSAPRLGTWSGDNSWNPRRGPHLPLTSGAWTCGEKQSPTR